MSSFYITTPIYYVNDVPHLGHAYTTIAADAFARYHRMRGDATRFLTGTDEHGQKIEEAATKRGLTPQALTDDVSTRFAETWTQLGIANDDFIRTTEPRHSKFVQKLWQRIETTSPGDLYIAAYEGWYCVSCEAFYTESQLEKDPSGTWCCAIHHRAVDWVAKERSWFFKMSKYAEALLAHIDAHPEFIQPEAYRNEVVSFVKSGLRDLSVSRTSFGWGIPVPTPDPEGHKHVMYVWLDALTNYLSALGDPDAADPFSTELIKKFWPDSDHGAVHVIGKDILRFHAVYWPCFLLAANLPLPKTIFSHGWWTVRGEKISKSLPATRIAPVELSQQLAIGNSYGNDIGVDALRYYLLREVPLGLDGDFTFESLFGRYNAELANDLGNLVNRSLAMMNKLGGAHPPTLHAQFDASGAHQQLVNVTREVIVEAGTHFEAFSPSKALESIWRLVREANRYIDATQPWVLARTEANHAEVRHVFHRLRAVQLTIARLVAPVMPTASVVLRGWMGDSAPAGKWPTGADDDATTLTAWSTVATPLFPRLDDDRQAAIVAAILPGLTNEPLAAAPSDAKAPAAPKKAPVTTEAPTGAVLTYDDFMKAELRLGEIVAAIAVPKAKKLLQLTVNLAEAAPRTIVAGIAEAYPDPSVLVGKRVIVVANLAPATIRGIRSEGMVLAAGDDAILGLSAVDPVVGQSVPVGSRVR